jgi:2-polyprenyl-6-methoxyphenol hydroxylase-like FAD-dependent oxidoreductase
LDRRGLLTELWHERATWPKMPFAGLWPLLELGAMRSDHPYLLNVPQTRVEEVLEARAIASGTTLRRSTRVVGVAPDDTGVTVTVDGPDGQGEIRCRYLVGCDGGRSAVRKATGIDFPGTDPTVSGMLCDCTLPTMAKERRGITRTAVGTVNLNPRPNGVVRIVTTEFGRVHPDRDAPVTVAEFRDTVRRILGRDLEIVEPTYLTRFSDTTRQAESYRVGRVLLAGDAAHVHYPYGGLGLNLGIQDATNLGWKLAAELAGWALPDLLDTYQLERQPAAASVLDYSRIQIALLHPDRNVTALRGLFGQLLEFPEVNRYLAELATGVSTRYDLGDGHPLTGSFAGDLTVKSGDGEIRLAALLAEGRGVLLDLGTGACAAVAAAWSPRVRVVTAAHDDPPAAALLVRPDGYVAWAAGAQHDDAGLRVALRRWFGVPAE